MSNCWKCSVRSLFALPVLAGYLTWVKLKDNESFQSAMKELGLTDERFKKFGETYERLKEAAK